MYWLYPRSLLAEIFTLYGLRVWQKYICPLKLFFGESEFQIYSHKGKEPKLVKQFKFPKEAFFEDFASPPLGR